MKKLLAIITGSIARSHEGTTYYRCTAYGTDNKVYSFKAHEEPALKAVACITHYPVDSIDWEGKKVETPFSVCDSVTNKETMLEAKALASELAGIEL